MVRRARRNSVTIFKCAGCNHKIDRLKGAVDHQRARWGHKPFTCEDPGWYDAGTSVVICFFAD